MQSRKDDLSDDSLARSRSRNGRSIGLAVSIALAGVIAAIGLPAGPPDNAAPRLTDDHGDRPVCGAISPTLAILGDRYIDPDSTVVGTDSVDRRQDLETALAGNSAQRSSALSLSMLYQRLASGELRRGEGRRVRCMDTEPSYPVTWLFDLEQVETVNLLTGHRLITAFEDRHSVESPVADRRISGALVAEQISILPRDRWRIDTDGRSLTSNLRFHRRGATGPNCSRIVAAPGLSPVPRACSALNELDWTTRAIGNAVLLEQVLYVNGRRAEWVTWRLEG